MFNCRWDVVMDFSRGLCFEPTDARRRFLGRCPRCWKLREWPAATWRPQQIKSVGIHGLKCHGCGLTHQQIFWFCVEHMREFRLYILTKHESHTSRGPTRRLTNCAQQGRGPCASGSVSGAQAQHVNDFYETELVSGKSHAMQRVLTCQCWALFLQLHFVD